MLLPKIDHFFLPSGRDQITGYDLGLWACKDLMRQTLSSKILQWSKGSTTLKSESKQDL